MGAKLLKVMCLTPDDSYYLLSAKYAPGIVLSAVCAFPLILWQPNRIRYPLHFTYQSVKSNWSILLYSLNILSTKDMSFDLVLFLDKVLFPIKFPVI